MSKAREPSEGKAMFTAEAGNTLNRFCVQSGFCFLFNASCCTRRKRTLRLIYSLNESLPLLSMFKLHPGAQVTAHGIHSEALHLLRYSHQPEKRSDVGRTFFFFLKHDSFQTHTQVWVKTETAAFKILTVYDILQRKN